ncbi:MAG TPA: Ig-like domain-containing protein [Verrucomicrobiae bacterium]|nr:Ig-like domain-containing protein [Verrucomicrobiae bacterium]
MKSTAKILTVAAIATFFISIQSDRGATTNVFVGYNNGPHFFPTNVLISTGDSVIWQWVSANFHTTTSGTNGVHGDDNGAPCGLWDSGSLGNTGDTFTNTFTSAGAFYYYCSFHVAEGMTGEVIVGTLAPPAIGITNPPPGSVFAAPAAVTVQAAITNGGGAVTNVQFLLNSIVLTNESSAPFSVTTGTLAAGNYTLTAIAEDGNGHSATNAVAISVVTPLTLSLSNAFESGAAFQFNYPANIGLNYEVQRSSNLTTWVTLTTNTAATNPSVFVDFNATNGLNFYRVGRMPNP